MCKVSILVPIYRVEDYIKRCLISLFEQTYEDIEYVFVDDKGNDNSLNILDEVLESYPHRKPFVKVIDHVFNRGLAAARNTALVNAEGEFIIHVDSDDYVEPNMVEECVARQLQFDSDIVLFGFRHVYSTYGYPEYHGGFSSVAEYVKKLILRETPVCIWGAMYRKSLYQTNDITAIEGLNMGEDYVTKPRLAYCAKTISTIDLPLYNYVHYNEGSYTNNFSRNSVCNLYKATSVLRAFFVERCGEEYSEIIDLAEIKQGIILLKLWARSKCSGIDDLREILSHMESKVGLLQSIPFIDRNVYTLAKREMLLMLRWYVNIGIVIKQYWKRK